MGDIQRVVWSDGPPRATRGFKTGRHPPPPQVSSIDYGPRGFSKMNKADYY